MRGRGVSENPPNRFEPIHVPFDPDFYDPDDPAPKTVYYRDSTKQILATNDSPDIPFDFSVNPYRGCQHGCVYCYARPTHEYMGLSAGLDFETKIFIKEDAPELLRKELSKKKWVPQFISLSGVTDAYQPIERQLKLTRRCLEVLRDFRNPVGIVTKNALVERDADLLAELAEFGASHVYLSITTLDASLTRILEPRASMPEARLRAIETLAKAGIPVGVMNAPIIPGLNDQEVAPILQAASAAGAKSAGYVMLRLPFGLKDLFETWLNQHFPEKKEKVLNRIRELRDGNLNGSEFGQRMRGVGQWADLFNQLFEVARKKGGLERKLPKLRADSFRNPSERGLFDDCE
jgi:DNA repair photolyase